MLCVESGVLQVVAATLLSRTFCNPYITQNSKNNITNTTTTQQQQQNTRRRRKKR